MSPGQSVSKVLGLHTGSVPDKAAKFVESPVHWAKERPKQAY
jgi:hypothetical protein